MRLRTNFALAAVATAVGTTAALLTTARAAQRAMRRVHSGSHSFFNKTVVVTGASRGLGLVLARQLVQRGAKVALLARDGDKLDRALKQFTAASDRVLAIPCDVTNESEVQKAIEKVRRILGPIDVLINNAGRIAVGPMDTMTEAEYRESLDLHFWAPFFTTMAVLPEMRKRREGRIVNISSIGGKISVPHLLPYSVGKFALAGFSEGLRPELVRDNVFVTSVYPGLMRTGSPRNAEFKGKHRAEYGWFSISDANPLLSVSAERAAREILNACARGQATLTISLPAKAAIRIKELFPNSTAALISLANRTLPDAGGIGQRRARGRESFTPASPSWITWLDTLAARRNNQIAG